ncbi:MAG: GNAT family N-acetyltransferase [Promethearchaeota archaeon]
MKNTLSYDAFPPRDVKISDGRMIQLRLFKKDDLDGIWNNFNEVVAEGIYLPVYTPVLTEWEKLSWYHDILDEDNICIVAIDPRAKNSEKIIGQITIEHIPWEAAKHVGQLGIIVKKGYRNLGIGYFLIQMAKEVALSIGKQKFILSTLANNEMGIGLYRKCGFISVGTYSKQYLLRNSYQDELLMEWEFFDDQ